MPSSTKGGVAAGNDVRPVWKKKCYQDGIAKKVVRGGETGRRGHLRK